nr:capsid protein [Mute swan feces associated chapparvovirus 4]
MADDVTFSHCYIAYIHNAPYNLPQDTYAADLVDRTTAHATGWHIAPTFLWRHFLTNKDWFHLVSNYEAYLITGTSFTVFNMVPMATQLAIQGNTLFTSFNNCIYGWGYTDDLYETAYHNWFNEPKQPNFYYPEGLWYANQSTSRARYTLPLYSWRQPLYRVSATTTYAYQGSPSNSGEGVYPQIKNPTGIMWNPLNRPDTLMELRPGKNSMHFSWHPHECDAGKWINLDQIAYLTPAQVTGPYCGKQRPGTLFLSDQCDPEILSSQRQASEWYNDYTIPDLAWQPICPAAWFWKELQYSIINPQTSNYPNMNKDWMKPNLYFPGTEYQLYKYGTMQHFLKLVPLLDETATNIEFHAQIACKVTISLKCKKRRSALYAPTAGPFCWRQLYSAQSADIHFNPSLIRGRTGGARILWQNIADTDGQAAGDGHLREDPYNNTRTADAGTGVGQTRAAPIYTTAQAGKPDLKVTFSKTDDRVVIETAPQPIKRKSKIASALDAAHSMWQDKMDTHM